MISAENLALESEVTKQLLKIKEAEVTFYTDRFNAIGTQAALMGGFLIESLASQGSHKEKRQENDRVYFLIYTWASAVALVCCMHCIICTTYGSIWGPSLSLRGPGGSVMKATNNMRRESKHILVSYNILIFAYCVHFMMAFLLIDVKLDNSSDEESMGFQTWVTWPPVGISIFGMLYTLFAIFRMQKRMKHKKVINVRREELQGLFHDGGDSSALESTPKGSAESTPTTTEPRGDRNTWATRSISQSNMQGYLLKRGNFLGGKLNNKWSRRYFVLNGIAGAMYSFKDREAYHRSLEGEGEGKNRKNGIPRGGTAFNMFGGRSKTYPLAGYEVMVVPGNTTNGSSDIFMLSNMDNTMKDHYFRAQSEEGMEKWVRALVNASVMAGESI